MHEESIRCVLLDNEAFVLLHILEHKIAKRISRFTLQARNLTCYVNR